MARGFWNVRCDTNALPGVLVKDEVLAGRREREFFDARLGSHPRFCRTTPKQSAAWIGFEDIERLKHEGTSLSGSTFVPIWHTSRLSDSGQVDSLCRQSEKA
jgi:hypothetical protein